MTIFTKPIKQSKHYDERKKLRASDSDIKRDFHYRNIKRLAYSKNAKGQKVIHVFTRSKREYRMVEKWNCFLIMTVIQYSQKTFEKAMLKRGC